MAGPALHGGPRLEKLENRAGIRRKSPEGGGTLQGKAKSERLQKRRICRLVQLELGFQRPA